MIRSTLIIVLTICHQISTYELFYPELEYLGVSCYPRDSCRPIRNEDEDHLWGNRSCECGVHCIQYGTCCVDSPHVGKSLTFEYHSEVCQKLPTFRDVHVVHVARCSHKFRYGYLIKEKCECDNFYWEDPMAMAPVTSLATHVTYKNYFCALCNFDNRNAVLWDIELELYGTKESDSGITDEFVLENMIYDNERKSWGIAKADAFYNLKSRYKLPSFLQNLVKKCYPDMVTQCDPYHSFNYEVQYKCLSYYAPIRLKQDDMQAKKYRNIHCAICNNVNATLIDDSICDLEIPKVRTPSTFSFALLLDVNRSDGDLVGKKQTCGDNEKWDPFFKKCRNLACALPGYVLKNGRCTQN